ncbi:MAG TPA: DUF551 domain-containing protein [Pyrinomonadaceae bacterium]|nr:DUF551 domain-containing protein [Pyrinomonadaceae bacterium]
MAWIKVADSVPPENELVLIYDNRNNKMEIGRTIDGKWYVEDTADGQLREIAEVTHWSWVLDSETYDSAED